MPFRHFDLSQAKSRSEKKFGDGLAIAELKPKTRGKQNTGE